MIKSFLAISLFSASSIVFAHSTPAVEGDIDAGEGYVQVGDSVLLTGTSNCTHSGSYSDDTAIAACEGSGKAVAPQKANVITAGVSGVSLFKSNEATLNAAGKAAIDDVIKQLEGFKNISSVTVVGHTDSRGAEAYNLDLSERRAATVAALLKKRYPDTKIKSEGMGEASPIASNDTAEGRQKNRRVEVEVKATKMTFN